MRTSEVLRFRVLLLAKLHAMLHAIRRKTPVSQSLNNLELHAIHVGGSG